MNASSFDLTELRILCFIISKSASDNAGTSTFGALDGGADRRVGAGTGMDSVCAAVGTGLAVGDAGVGF